MNFKEILELIDKVSQSGIAAVEIEQAGTKLRIEGKSLPPQVIQAPPLPPAAGALPPPAHPAAPAAGSAEAREAAEIESEAGLHIITSPIVGTFYRAPSPESESYINVGDHISKGKVLCIVEAMKLMNEIESDLDGTVMRIYPQNGQPVEYGEKLFAVRL